MRHFVLTLSLLAACSDDAMPADASADAADTSTADASSDAAADGTTGDATNDASDAAQSNFAMDYCEARRERDMRCMQMPIGLGECLMDRTCVHNQLLRPDAASATTECIRNLGCGMGDDDCFVAATLMVPPTTGADTYQTACLMRREECGGGFGDDFCFADILSEAAIADFTACLASPCDDIRTCFQGVLTCS